MRNSESRATRPHAQPSWTDFNRSDPGITIAELLDYAEDLVFRATRSRRGRAAILVAAAFVVWWWRRRGRGD